MNWYHRTAVFLAMALLLSVPALAQAQTGAIRGRVVDGQTGQPIVGVQLLVTGTQRGNITDQNGVFLIPGVPVGERELRATHIGYGSVTQNVTVRAEETATVELTMRTAVIDMQEIVVTGVSGEATRAKLPFTVDRLSQATMPVPAGNAAAMITGKVAGAIVAAPTGRPGSAPSILLRGPTSINASGRSQEPLYIVDGVILTGSVIDIDANDIESIEIVKGAAAASLYGSRAADGVIQIRTNRGRNVANDQVRYTVRTEYGTGEIHGRFNLTQKHHFAMQGNQFLDQNGNPCNWLECTSIRMAGQKALPGDGANEWNTIQQEAWPGQTYDHMERFFQSGANVTNSLSVQGRSGGTTFYTSYNRTDDDGVMPFHRGQLRHQFRLNVDQSMRQDLTLSASVAYTRQSLQTSEGNMFQLTRMPAGVDLMSPDPNFPEFIILKPDPFNDNANPLLDMMNTHSEQKRSRFLGTVNLSYTPLEWLKFEGDVSFDRADISGHGYRRNNVPNLNGSLRDGTISYSHNRIEGMNASANAQVQRRFGDLVSTTSLRYLIEREDDLSMGVNSSKFIAEEVYTIGNTPSANRSGSSSTQPERRDGFFISQDFDFKDRYVLRTMIRQDGTSRFGADHRRQWYYRVGGRYRLAEEPWFNVPEIDELGLRYSIGTAGKTPSWSAQYETYSVTEGGITPQTLGNRNLRPEVSTEHEMGVDIAFGGRFSFDLTHARTTVRDQILNVPSLAYTGFSSQWLNGGTLKSNTWESTLTAQFRPRNDLTWTSRLLFDRTRQQITELNRPPYQTGVSGQGLGTVFYVREGEELGTFYGRQFATECSHLGGLDCSQFQVNDDGFLVWVGNASSWRDGWKTYTDEEGATKTYWGTVAPFNAPDGAQVYWGTPFVGVGIDRVTGEETTFLPLGKTMPDYTLGWSNTIAWKNFTLYGLLQSVQGYSVYNQPLQWATFQSYSGIMDQSGVAEDLKKPVGYYGRLYGATGLVPSSAFVDDASHIKLREVQLSYRMGRDLLDRLSLTRGFEALRFSVTGNNLLTWSKYDGYDPDVGSTGGGTGSAALARVDGYSYPPYRTVRLGVEVIF